MRQSRGWARVRPHGAHIMRLGAWYQVVGNTAPNLVVLDIARGTSRSPAIFYRLAHTGPNDSASFLGHRVNSAGNRTTRHLHTRYVPCRVLACGFRDIPKASNVLAAGTVVRLTGRSLPNRLPPGVETDTA